MVQYQTKTTFESRAEVHGSGQLRRGGLVWTAFKDRGPTAKSNLASFRFLTMHIKDSNR